MVGPRYWTTGIKVMYIDGYGGPAWGTMLEFFDDGFCEPASTEGRLKSRFLFLESEGPIGEFRTRYFVKDSAYREGGLTAAIDLLIQDATRLGIEFRQPTLYIKGDGEDPECPYPSGWRDLIRRQCERLRWRFAYEEAEVS